MTSDGTLTAEQRATLDLLAEMIIPEDEFDEGLKGVGFAGIIETRNKYQPWMARLYEVGLKGIQQISNIRYRKSFPELEFEQRTEILNSIADGTLPGDVWAEDATPLNFFTNLHNDACFVYCTQEEVWERIGFPGASFDTGGYSDYSDPQD